ncbi:MAG: single-stranded DNA-binding protein [Clostridiales bacterium]|nr:single-stranded DNA-binding protein [Clostridiales bacterium]
MNKVILIGRLTKDPEVSTTQGGVSRAAFTLAVDRRFTDKDGNRLADFISCTAWRSTAEFIGKYFGKGKKIGIVGSLQSRSYDAQDGTKRYVTEVNVDEAEFVESKTAEGNGQQPAEYTPGHAEAAMTEETDDELPF